MRQARRYSFLLASEADWQGFSDGVTRRYRFAALGAKTAHVVYLDSFDWRLWRRGGVLEYHQGDEQGKLTWRGVGQRDIYAEFPLERRPAFVADIPAWLLPPALTEIIHPRRLIAHARSRLTLQRYEILDEAGKTVARVNRVAEAERSAKGDGDGPALAERLEVLSARGYGDAFDFVAAAAEQAGLAAYGKDPLARLLRMRGGKPRDYSLALNVHIERGQRADTVAKRISLRWLQIMRANEGGIRDDTDTVFLHDFRYALQRMRSLTDNAVNVFPRAARERLDEDLAWLQHETAALRALDDWRLNFHATRDLLPRKQRPRLTPLLEWLRPQRQAEQQRVAALLGGEKYARFCARWQTFMQSEPPAHGALKHAAAPINAVVAAQLWRAYKNLLKFAGREPQEPRQLPMFARRVRALRDVLELRRALAACDAPAALRETAEDLRARAEACLHAHHKLESLRAYTEAMRQENRLQKKPAKALRELARLLEKEWLAKGADLAAPYRALTDEAARRSLKALRDADAAAAGP